MSPTTTHHDESHHRIHPTLSPAPTPDTNGHRSSQPGTVGIVDPLRTHQRAAVPSDPDVSARNDDHALCVTYACIVMEGYPQPCICTADAPPHVHYPGNVPCHPQSVDSEQSPLSASGRLSCHPLDPGMWMGTPGYRSGAAVLVYRIRPPIPHRSPDGARCLWNRGS